MGDMVRNELTPTDNSHHIVHIKLESIAEISVDGMRAM